MSCLRHDQIYLYLEKELSVSETKVVETHLQSCTTCCDALKERQDLHYAMSHLPLWNPPANFALQVMNLIFPERISFRAWLTAMSVGISSVVTALFFAYLLSGQNLAQLLLPLGRSLLGFVQNSSILIIKIYKFAVVILKIVGQIGRFFLEGFSALTALISPQVQFFLILFTILISFALVFGAKRIFVSGAKT